MIDKDTGHRYAYAVAGKSCPRNKSSKRLVFARKYVAMLNECVLRGDYDCTLSVGGQLFKFPVVTKSAGERLAVLLAEDLARNEALYREALASSPPEVQSFQRTDP